MGVRHSGDHRVIRGGAWNSNAQNVRSGNRNGNDPGNRNDNLGFRLARARTLASRPAPDQTNIQSVDREVGSECAKDAGVLVGPRSGRDGSPASFFHAMRSGAT